MGRFSRGIPAPQDRTNLGHTDPNQQLGRAGSLLGGIALATYLLFVLLPNSGLMLMSWPYPAILLVGWIAAALWGLVQWWQGRPARGLGMGLDWAIGITAAVLVLSSAVSVWPHQGSWFTMQFVLYAIAMYGLAQWLVFPERRLWLWRVTAWIGFIFSTESLLLWWINTLSPKLSEIHQLRQLGLSARLDFAQVELQNIWPIFHQNYVAGFLLLVIPAAAGLVWLNRHSSMRWVWLFAVAIELATLWSTQSRGAWLGLLVMVLMGIGLWILRGLKSRRLQAIVTAATLGGSVAFMVSNPRLNATLQALQQGSFDQFAFRGAAAQATWTLFIRNPLWGTGPGTAAWAYLEAKPDWTGEFAQTMAHLHSTPLQLVAELGGLGLLVMGVWVAVFARIGWRFLSQGSHPEQDSDRIWAIALGLGLVGYTIEALSDYQLDVVAISGYLVIAIAGLASMTWQLQTENSTRQEHSSPGMSRRQQILLGGVGIVAIVISLVIFAPRYIAWGISSQGLEAYFDNNFPLAEQKLQQAQLRFHSEPFYPIQLGWINAKLAREHPDANVRQEKYAEAIAWFERSLEVLPPDEFVHTNLGFLLAERNPAAAIEHFQRSLKLSPARSAIASGLALAHLQQGNPDAAIGAVVREIIRHPQMISSPLWEQVLSPEQYVWLVQSLNSIYERLLERYPEANYLRHNWAAIRWWLGDDAGALVLLQPGEQPLLQALIAVSVGDRDGASNLLAARPRTPLSALLQAWLQPTAAEPLLAQAATQSPLVKSLAAPTPDQTLRTWLQQPAAVLPRKASRNYLTQGVYRRIDGPNLTDTFALPTNWVIAEVFNQPFDTPQIAPELDRQLAALTSVR